MPTRTVTLFESAPLAGASVDRAAGVLRGVLICGVTSANNRDYPWRTSLKDSHGVYEGVHVNCDHSAGATIDRKLGWLENVAPGPGGTPRGDLHILKTHPMAERVFEAAERNPSLYGLSHVADCKTTKTPDGRERIESIVAIESVDLVARPATTKGFFESTGTGKGNQVAKTTVRKVLEGVGMKVSIPKLIKLRWLAEDDTIADASVDAPPDGASPDDTVDAAFKGAMHAVVDGYFTGTDAKEVLTKLKSLFKSHGDISDSGGDSDVTDSGDDEMPKSLESRRNKPAGTSSQILMEALDACHAAGFASPTKADLQIVAGSTDRPAVIQRLKASAGVGEKPKSFQRALESVNAGTKTVQESRGNDECIRLF